MSVILDALKKLDREKSLQRTRPSNIAEEILMSDSARSDKKTPLLLIAVSITAGIVTYASIAGLDLLLNPSPAVPVTSSTLHQENPQVTSGSTSTYESVPSTITSSASEPMPSETTSTPVQGRFTVRENGAQKSQPFAKTQFQPRDMYQNKPSLVSSIENKTSRLNAVPYSRDVAAVPDNTRRGYDQTPKQSSFSSSSLRISGIIWNDEPSKRIAIINDSSFSEGSDIEGAKIVEIFPTFVRFSLRGQTVEIPMGSTIPR